MSSILSSQSLQSQPIYLNFTKMHGAGNDFIVLNALNGLPNLSVKQFQYLADRRYGIGCDQLLIVAPPIDPNNDFSYRIINCDGNEVEQCGNGARCFMRFILDEGLTTKKTVRVEVGTGVIVLHECAEGLIEVNMGLPRFKPNEVPFNPQGLNFTIHPDTGFVSYRFIYSQSLISTIDNMVDNIPINKITALNISVVNIGNPHAVHIAECLDTIEIDKYGAWLENHSAFPNKVNVGFMEIIDLHSIKLRVWERGVGETLACGTGACAAAVIGIAQNVLKSPVTVHAIGGILTILWEGKTTDSILMRGPAVNVYKGSIQLD